MSLIGIFGFWYSRHDFGKFLPSSNRWLVGAVATLFLLWLINVFAAAAPSSKVDELYYHMLLPKRLIEDGGLVFYQIPWQAAVLPQMLYQMGCSVFHALRLPDAGNILSICIAGEFLLLGFRLAYHKGGMLASWLAVGLASGVYGASWWVTSGAHALGDFASGALCLWVLFPESRKPFSRGQILLLGGLFAALAIGTKVTLAPLILSAGALLVLGSDKRNLSWKLVLENTFLFALPGLVYLGPIAVWTWIQSGSPLGPILAGWLGSSAYNVDYIKGVLHTATEVNQPSLKTFLYLALPTYPALYWIGWGLCLFLAGKFLSVRIAILLIPQFLVILLLTHFDLRFLGGLPWALGILGAGLLGARLVEFGNIRRWVLAAGVVIIPWAGVQAYYLRPFCATSLGTTSREEFRTEYVAFWDDYKQLDELLPSDSAITSSLRLNAFYCPRKVYFLEDADLVDPAVGIYYFADERQQCSPQGFETGSILYQNPRAKAVVFRRPGVAHKYTEVRVTELRRVSTN